MASAVRKLTGVGGDIRKIARLLQKEAPPGHMLAYINQEEADLLKARGGSGKPHADTGVPSFQEEYEGYDMTSMPSSEPFDAQAYQEAARVPIQPSDFVTSGAPLDSNRYTSAVTADVPANNADAAFVSSRPYGTGSVPPGISESDFANQYALYGAGQLATTPVSAEGAVPYIPTPRETGNYPGGSVPTDVKNVEPGFFEGLSKDTKARLGIGGAQAVLGAYQISQASDQAKKYREDMAKLAQPYQAEGKKLIAQAQSGELTPAAQQQLQAAQAQAAQGAQARGGVGAQQAMMAVENMRQQLLQNQYDYGLKVSGIGDQIASGAIKAGMQADQYVNSLAGSYANNIARTLSNAPTYVTSYSQNRE
jgi:hypothetical protein